MKFSSQTLVNLLFWVALIGIALGSLLPGHLYSRISGLSFDKMSFIPYDPDKIAHFVSYFILAILSYSFFFHSSLLQGSRHAAACLFLSFLLVLMVGGVLEFLQAFTSRSADINDFFANLLGGGTGCLVVYCGYSLLRFSRQHKQHKRNPE